MWVLIMAIYFAPPSSVDWRGTYELGLTRLSEERFASEKSCLDRGEEHKTNLRKGMLAPVHYQCLKLPATYPYQPSVGQSDRQEP